MEDTCEPVVAHPRRVVVVLAAGAAVASLLAAAGDDVEPVDGLARVPRYVGGGVWGGG
jgi:hypothetical protein